MRQGKSSALWLCWKYTCSASVRCSMIFSVASASRKPQKSALGRPVERELEQVKSKRTPGTHPNLGLGNDARDGGFAFHFGVGPNNSLPSSSSSCSPQRAPFQAPRSALASGTAAVSFRKYSSDEKSEVPVSSCCQHSIFSSVSYISPSHYLLSSICTEIYCIDRIIYIIHDDRPTNRLTMDSGR